MNALPSHVRSYLAVRFPVLLLCVNRRRSVRPLCGLRRRGRKPRIKKILKKRERSLYEELNADRLPAPFHTRWGSPNSPVDEGPRVQCAALSLQTALIGGRDNEVNAVDYHFSRDVVIFGLQVTEQPLRCVSSRLGVIKAFYFAIIASRGSTLQSTKPE